MAPGLAIETVDVKVPVEVVGLVLKAAAENTRTFNLNRLAHQVEAGDHGSPSPRRRSEDVGKGKATLFVLVDAFGVNERGVDHIAFVTVDVVREHALADADLGAAKPARPGSRHVSMRSVTSVARLSSKAVTGRHAVRSTGSPTDGSVELSRF